MSDNFTEVTSEGWLSRLGGAVKGVLIGGVLVLIAFVVLFWNEGRAVKRYKTLKEGGGAVVSVSAETVNPGNEGKLVHLTGRADTDATVTDAAFGVSTTALKLKRTVESYQWKETSRSETRKKLGGGTETVTTYDYAKDWSSTRIDSSSFKHPEGHENPAALPYQNQEQTADPIVVGGFRLSASLIAKLQNYEKLPVSAEAAAAVKTGGTAGDEGAAGGTQALRVHDGGYYLGADPAAPKVGDVRVTFQVVKPGEVSIVAQQAGDSFVPYLAKAGGSIELLESGIRSADAMIQQAKADNKTTTWILRFVGFMAMAIGFSMILKPLSVLADVVPLLGDVVGVGTGIIAFLASAVLSLITIAIAWIVFRPLLAVCLILAAAAAAVFVVKKLRAEKAT